jgi:hypothetical protein
VTPRSPTPPEERDDQSPLAESILPPPPSVSVEHTTLTSASASAIVLPATVDSVGYEVFAQIDEAPRRIIAAIGLAFPPEDLEGKRVIVACNLPPRDFGKGLVSEGLILSAGSGEGLALATVTQDLPPGTRIK